jgi:hypothetical protein
MSAALKPENRRAEVLLGVHQRRGEMFFSRRGAGERRGFEIDLRN